MGSNLSCFKSHNKSEKDILINIKNKNDIGSLSFKDKKLWCLIDRVVDGDTFVGIVIFESKPLKFKFRLGRIDCYEIHSKDEKLKNLAIDGLNYSKDFYSKQKNVVWIACGRNDKYGRILCDVFNDSSMKCCLNDELVQKSLAVTYNGGKKTI